MSDHDEWAVDCANPRLAVLRGVMRLESVEAYERAFAEMRRQSLSASGASAYVIDLSEVVLMNSSGIRALGALVLDAKRAGLALVIRGKASVVWQRKSVPAFQTLHPGLTVDLG
jgi:hypothetical protein